MCVGKARVSGKLSITESFQVTLGYLWLRFSKKVILASSLSEPMYIFKKLSGAASLPCDIIDFACLDFLETSQPLRAVLCKSLCLAGPMYILGKASPGILPRSVDFSCHSARVTSRS